MLEIEITSNSIVESGCEAIVNAANSDLLRGGGVCGEIFNKAGDSLEYECKIITKDGPLNFGEATITSSHDLLKNGIKYIIHAIGPFVVDFPTIIDKVNLVNCYINVIEYCLEYGINSVAIPCISTGIYNFPKKEAASLVFELFHVLDKHDLKNYPKIVLSCFDKENFEIYQAFFSERV